MTIQLQIEVMLADGGSPDDVVERLYELLAADPDDLFPEIDTVDSFGYVVLP